MKDFRKQPAISNTTIAITGQEDCWKLIARPREKPKDFKRVELAELAETKITTDSKTKRVGSEIDAKLGMVIAVTATPSELGLSAKLRNSIVASGRVILAVAEITRIRDSN